MSQQKVFNILIKEDKWLTTVEITGKMNKKKQEISQQSVRKALNQLYKYGEIYKRFNRMGRGSKGDSWKGNENGRS